jgi:1-acyl-sn-glycerol-3-phosphate acyltransferase
MFQDVKGRVFCCDPVILSPVQFAQLLITLSQTQIWVRGRDFLPKGPAIVVSNHRSFLDAPILMVALDRPIHIACHYYLSQVPGIKDIVLQLGCLPLRQGSRNQIQFFRQAELIFAQGGWVGVFPEGAERIACKSSPREVGVCHAGFVHLALRSQASSLPILPVGIRVYKEKTITDIPLSFFRWFDPTEPMFQGNGFHPVLLYEEVEVCIGEPLLLDPVSYASMPKRKYIQDFTEKTRSVLQEMVT